MVHKAIMAVLLIALILATTAALYLGDQLTQIEVEKKEAELLEQKFQEGINYCTAYLNAYYLENGKVVLSIWDNNGNSAQLNFIPELACEDQINAIIAECNRIIEGS